MPLGVVEMKLGRRAVQEARRPGSTCAKRRRAAAASHVARGDLAGFGLDRRRMASRLRPAARHIDIDSEMVRFAMRSAASTASLMARSAWSRSTMMPLRTPREA